MTGSRTRRKKLVQIAPVLFCDADNTLWDTDAVYREAHLWLFAEAAKHQPVRPDVKDPLAFVRFLDQELAESHPAHLRYPPSLLVKELFRKLAHDNVPPSDEFANRVASEFITMIGKTPKLRQDVTMGLEQLSRLQYPVHVVTETSVERCINFLRYHDIAGHVMSVESMRKDERSFLHLRHKLPIRALAWMVGDQLTRDILPARSAGFRTIYFPSTFQPKWENSITIDSTVIQITAFSAVPQIMEHAQGNDGLQPQLY